MKLLLKWSLLFLLHAPGLFAQHSPEPLLWDEPTEKDPVITENYREVPLDGVVAKETVAARLPLAYPAVRESDILWEKGIWRVIDVREKMNLPFVYPEAPLFTLLRDAALRGDLPVFSTENDKFTQRLSTDALHRELYRRDTVVVIDPHSYEERVTVVENEIDWNDVKRFRLKEIWYFDSRTSTLQVRIIGIAPLLNVYDNEGNFRFEKPLFWVYYPYARDLLARTRVFTHGGNLNASITWEDLFEMRYFSSSVYKESNIYDRKLEHYLSGTDLLMAGTAIQNSLLHFDEDMWQR